jgi:hypothetical protein
MRSILALILLAATAAAQQCSQGNAALFQDDVLVSGSCGLPAVFNGATLIVKETQAIM